MAVSYRSMKIFYFTPLEKVHPVRSFFLTGLIRQFVFHPRTLISYLLFCILHFAFCISFVYPLPQVDKVISGQAEIQYPDPQTLKIEAINKTVINHQIALRRRRFMRWI